MAELNPWNEASWQVLSFLGQISIKAAVFAGLAGLVMKAAKLRSLSARNWAWSTVLAAMLAFPAFALLAPTWEFKVLPLPAPAAEAPAQTEISRSRSEAIGEAPRLGEARRLPTASERHEDDHGGVHETGLGPQKEAGFSAGAAETPLAPTSAFGWAFYILLAYLGIAAALTCRLAVGMLGGRRLTATAAESSDPRLEACVADLFGRLPRARRVRVGISPGVKVPVTLGILRPWVLLPQECRNWEDSKLRSVLAHELTHVRRGDCFTKLAADLNCCIYWFHPLSWMAARRLAEIAEMASDSSAARFIGDQRRYAQHLLEVASALKGSRQRVAWQAVSMARSSQLASRVQSVLAGGNESRLPRRLGALLLALAATAAALMASVSLSGAHPITAPEPGFNPSKAAAHSPQAEEMGAGSQRTQPQTPTPTPAPTPHVKPRAKPQPAAEAPSSPPAESSQQGTERGRLRAIKVDALKKALQDEDPMVRRTAAHALSEVGGPEAADALTGALKDPDPSVKQTALWALGETRDKRYLNVFVETLSDSQGKVRAHAAWVLGEMGDPRAVEALIAALDDSDAKVRSQSAWALGEIGDGSAIEALGKVLEDDNAEARKLAIHALAEIGDRRTAPWLAKALSDSDQGVRRTAAWALGELEDPVALEPLGAALNDDDVQVASTAAWALGELGHESSVPALVKALQHTSSKVRKKAAWALGEIRDPSAAEGLSKAVEDEDHTVQETALWALSEIKDRSTIPALIKALDISSPKAAAMAAWALGEIGDRQASAALSRALSHESESVRVAALHALGEIGDSETVEAIIRALQDENPKVRKQAAWALGEIGDPRALDALMKALEDDNREVRRTAALAIAEID